MFAFTKISGAFFAAANFIGVDAVKGDYTKDPSQGPAASAPATGKISWPLREISPHNQRRDVAVYNHKTGTYDMVQYQRLPSGDKIAAKKAAAEKVAAEKAAAEQAAAEKAAAKKAAAQKAADQAAADRRVEYMNDRTYPEHMKRSILYRGNRVHYGTCGGMEY